MVLRPGAWESSAPPVFFPGPQPHDEAGGFFFALDRARASPCGTFHVEQFHRIILVGGKAKYLENIEACSILLFQILER